MAIEQRISHRKSLSARAALGEATGIDPLVTEDELCALSTESRSTVRRKVERGELPKPLKIGKARIAWRASELRAYLASLPRAA
ncbi:MAG: helix-turn-helix transcriptional regulator [Hyphomicrobiaceae bacterium]